MSYNQQPAPLIPKRAAPPPPVGFAPPPSQPTYTSPPISQYGAHSFLFFIFLKKLIKLFSKVAQPPIPARTSQPSLSQYNQPAQQPYYSAQQPVQQAYYSPPTQQPYSQPSQPPQVNRSPQPQAQQKIVIQAGQAPPKQDSSLWGSVKSLWGGSKPAPTSEDKRNELLAGATIQKPSMPAANDPHWNQLSTNKAQQDDYYLKLANQVNTSSFQNTLNVAQETEQLGMNTLGELARQGEALDSVETDLEKIHLQLDRGEDQLRSINGISGAVSNLVRGDGAHIQNRVVYNMNSNGPRELTLETHHARPYNQQPAYGYNQPGSNQVYSPGQQSIKDKLAEQDRQLDALAGSLGNLQNIAGTMGTEVNRQNGQLDRINARTNEAVHRTHDANYRINRMM